MIIEKLEILCKEKGTNLTTLCKEITGSSGNLPTWKKDKIRPEWLRQICLKFNISSDFLLDLPDSNNITNFELSKEEQNVLIRFNRLKEDYQIKAQAYMVDLYEKQKLNESFENNNDLSVAADESLKLAK